MRRAHLRRMGFYRRALLPVLLAPSIARAQQTTWLLNQDSAQIGFSARHLGLFSSHGRFTRFEARLELDATRTTDALVEGRIQTAAVTLPFPGAEDTLRSPTYFDSARFPEARFSGRAAGITDAGAFTINGRMRIRNIEQPFAMTARLAERRRESQGDVARFTASGQLQRSAFGMVADRSFTADAITISVEVQLLV
jgi:polyisoprenoid-binding protein YceI